MKKYILTVTMITVAAISATAQTVLESWTYTGAVNGSLLNVEPGVGSVPSGLYWGSSSLTTVSNEMIVIRDDGSGQSWNANQPGNGEFAGGVTSGVYEIEYDVPYADFTSTSNLLGNGCQMGFGFRDYPTEQEGMSMFRLGSNQRIGFSLWGADAAGETRQDTYYQMPDHLAPPGQTTISNVHIRLTLDLDKRGTPGSLVLNYSVDGVAGSEIVWQVRHDFVLTDMWFVSQVTGDYFSMHADDAVFFDNIVLSSLGTYIPPVYAVEFEGTSITNARYIGESDYPLNTAYASLGPANNTGQPIYDGFNRAYGGGLSDLSAASITYEDQTYGAGGIRLQWNGGDPQTGLWDEGDITTGIFMFKKEDFLNGLDTGTVYMDADNDKLSATVVFEPKDPPRLTSASLRWVVGDAGQYYISDANVVTAVGTYSLTAEATEISWYNYYPETDITVVSNAAAPTLQDIDFLGFQLDATCGTNIAAQQWHHVMVSDFTAEATKNVDTPTSLWNDWIAGYPGVGANSNMLDHGDSDSLENLCEYAFDGDPSDGNDLGNKPLLSHVEDSGTNYIEYIYYERDDVAARGLASLLWIGTDLVTADWVDGSSYEVGRGGSTVPGFNAVTNRISADAASEQFIRLQIQFTP